MTPWLRIAGGAWALAVGAGALVLLSPFGGAPSGHSLLSLSAGHDDAAERLIRKNLEIDQETALWHSRRALETSPYNTGALLRIAYIDWSRDQTLDSEGQKALSESYDRVAVDPPVGLWRVRFSLENWSSLPLDLRKKVQNEFHALATEPGHRWPLRARLKGISDGQGRMVAALWTARLQRQMAPPVTTESLK